MESDREARSRGRTQGGLRIRLEDAAQAMEDFIFAPMVGLVQAGNPLEGIENAAGDFVPFPSVGRRSDASRFFSVSVEGYSMMNVGFMPGDVLLVESASGARNGDIVLAAVQAHEVTVKRFAMRGSHLYRNSFESLPKEDFSLQRIPPALLVPENPDFEPIPFGLSESDRVLGLVRSLYRKEIV
jgi:repressor LexA